MTRIDEFPFDEDVLREVRHRARRRRILQAAPALAMGVALATLPTLSSTPGTSGLDVVSPPVGGTPSPGEWPSEMPIGSPAPGRPLSPVPTPGGPQERPSASPTVDPSESAGPAEPSESPSPDRSATTASAVYSPDPNPVTDPIMVVPGSTDAWTCTESAGYTFGPDGWCIQLTDSERDPLLSEPAPAGSVSLVVRMCRQVGMGERVMQGDFGPLTYTVRDKATGAVLWSWTRTRSWFGDEPVKTNEGQCATFSHPWDKRDSAGERLSGTYRFDADMAGADWKSFNNSYDGRDVTVT